MTIPPKKELNTLAHMENALGECLPALEIFNQKSRDYSTYKAVFPINKNEGDQSYMGFCNQRPFPRNTPKRPKKKNMIQRRESFLWTWRLEHDKPWDESFFCGDSPQSQEGHTVDGRSTSWYGWISLAVFKGFILSRWCRISSIKNTT